MMKRLPERVADVSDAVFKRVDDRFAATAADLLDVCRLATVPKDDEARRACAALIAARCGDAGLDVQVLLDGAVVAPGAKATKAGAVAAVAAVDAVLRGLP